MKSLMEIEGLAERLWSTANMQTDSDPNTEAAIYLHKFIICIDMMITYNRL